MRSPSPKAPQTVLCANAGTDRTCPKAPVLGRVDRSVCPRIRPVGIRALPPNPRNGTPSRIRSPRPRVSASEAMRKATIILAVSLPLLHAQTPQQRDLTVKDATAPKAPRAAVAPPRSYALVIGIGKYQNLAEKENLLYSERDAESLYSILISPEGGSFPAQN